MSEEFNKVENHGKLRHLIGDVRDLRRLERALAGVDIAIHAAALKRIDILEYNVDECIKTNIDGTLNFVDACLKNDVGRAIFVSTDKACSPINTYGACKFVGERIFIESNFSKGHKKTIFSCVRYGNVVESTGSVIPYFEEKIKKKESVPLTDPQMTRFFITPDQAVKLIFDAIKNSTGGEIFVPKLPAFKIVDLIDVMKDKYKSKNTVEIIGIRPGEKLHELMLNDSEMDRTYDVGDYFVLTCQIENYRHIKEAKSYLQKGKLIDKGQHANYSSNDSLISKQKLRKLLDDYYFS